jgi:hypothetical protein
LADILRDAAYVRFTPKADITERSSRALVLPGRDRRSLKGGKAESKPEIEPALAARQNAELGRCRANASARPGVELVATLTKNQEENHG